jgi:anti-sigma B factor antagonist
MRAAPVETVMRYEQNEIDNVTVVSVHGNIVGNESRRRLVDRVWGLLAEDHTRIVLDVVAVRHVDSRGLGELIECFRAAQSRGGTVKLLGVNGRLSDLLVITKLVNVFECFDTRETAIASFAPLAVAC